MNLCNVFVVEFRKNAFTESRLGACLDSEKKYVV